MQYIEVVNIKCGGCEESIIDALTEAGLSNINVDVANQKVYFEGDQEKAKEILNKMGYPEAGSKQAKSLIKKAKSYISCAIGKTKKK